MRGLGESTTVDMVKAMVDELERPCIVPMIARVQGYKDPAKVYFSVRRRSSVSYLLESAEIAGGTARYSVIGYDPLLHLKVKGKRYLLEGRKELADMGSKRGVGGDALEVLKRMFLFDELEVPRLKPGYLVSAVGYVGYDYVRSFLDLGGRAKDDLGQPELEFSLPGKVIVFDHARGETIYCVNTLLSENSDFQEVCHRGKIVLKEMMKVGEIEPQEKRRKIRVRSNLTAREFGRAVEIAKQYIHEGDVIQVVLSRRIELDPAPPLESFYVNLRRINPSPYMFFLDFPERSVIGSSPEVQVKLDGERVTVRPIAGTRRRGANPSEDGRLERELLMDEKERAEHVMLVDLARNDVGKISRFGSVKVTEFMRVEKYSHVQHLVSNVVGELSPGRDAFDAFKATFPAGTVTGAPKVRAMEIIEELEGTQRGIYAGAVGSFSYIGDMDFAIAIRTLIAERGRGYVQVGAGVVADSVGWKEHYETKNKAKALLRAAGI